MKIFEYIKKNYLLPNDGTVVLLHGLENVNIHVIITLSRWCKEQNWKFVHKNEIMGSEASIVILYDIFDHQTELFSRAKNYLIIVHK